MIKGQAVSDGRALSGVRSEPAYRAGVWLVRLSILTDFALTMWAVGSFSGVTPFVPVGVLFPGLGASAMAMAAAFVLFGRTIPRHRGKGVSGSDSQARITQVIVRDVLGLPSETRR